MIKVCFILLTLWNNHSIYVNANSIAYIEEGQRVSYVFFIDGGSKNIDILESLKDIQKLIKKECK